MMAFGAMVIGCERHEFEGEDGTRQLHEKGTPQAAANASDDDAPRED